MKLHPVDNDIGAPELFCGPTVICAITGKPLSEVLAVIKDKREHFARDLERHRCDPALVSKAAVLASGDVTSTSTLDLEDAFTTFDSFMEHAAAFKDKSGPTLRDWLINDDYLTDEILTQYREGAALIFSIGQGDFDDPLVGHWVVIAGGEFLDTSTDGNRSPWMARSRISTCALMGSILSQSPISKRRRVSSPCGGSKLASPSKSAMRSLLENCKIPPRPATPISP